MTTIRHPEWITPSVNGEPHFGYDQEWYPQKRQKLAGCGPTVGAMTVAYVQRKHTPDLEICDAPYARTV